MLDRYQSNNKQITTNQTTEQSINHYILKVQMSEHLTNHKYNYTVRLYEQGQTNKTNNYCITINAKNSSQALYLAIKRFIRKYPYINITRMRIYSQTKNQQKRIAINIQ